MNGRDEWAAVPVEAPTDGIDSPSIRAARYRFVIESLIGGLEYQGVVKWLAMHDSLDEAMDAAERVRDGQIAT